MKSNKKNYRSDKAARSVLSYGALIAALSMVGYGLLIINGLLPAPHENYLLNMSIVMTLAGCWLLLVGFTFFNRQSTSKFVRNAEITGYFLLATAQTWLVTGLMSPFATFWVLLIVATFVLVGEKGLVAAVAYLLIVAVVDTLVLVPGQVSWAIEVFTTMLAITMSSLVIIFVYNTQRVSLDELAASRMRETAERDRVITLINNITDAVISTNRHGIVQTYNSAALSILNTNERIDGRFVSDLMKIEDGNENEIDVFKELTKNKSIRKRDDILMRLADDDQLRLEATFAPVQTSEGGESTPDNYVLILRDITRMKSLEEERDEFISVVSHELRTPVAIAEGSLSNASIMAERGYHEKASQAVSDAHKQVVFLARMVNDLSTLSRAERGISDDPELINTLELAHQLHGEYGPQAKAKDLQFNLDIIGQPDSVSTSRLYLQELLQNFIINAIKYTPKGSVTLRVQNIDDHVEFAVVDTGVGISKADLDKIFKRFYRTEDYRTRETNGTGLGLYVSSKLARKLGSKIEVDSRLNHGSTFSFKLPASGSKAPKN